MTIEQAKAILEAPKFGDPQCLAAAQRLRDADEEVRLRNIVVGKMLQCVICSYRGDTDCPMCKGAGQHAISRQLADSWDLDILKGVMEELRA